MRASAVAVCGYCGSSKHVTLVGETPICRSHRKVLMRELPKFEHFFDSVHVAEIATDDEEAWRLREVLFATWMAAKGYRLPALTSPVTVKSPMGGSGPRTHG
jgi:hypothetical protein